MDGVARLRDVVEDHLFRECHCNNDDKVDDVCKARLYQASEGGIGSGNRGRRCERVSK